MAQGYIWRHHPLSPFLLYVGNLFQASAVRPNSFHTKNSKNLQEIWIFDHIGLVTLWHLTFVNCKSRGFKIFSKSDAMRCHIMSIWYSYPNSDNEKDKKGLYNFYSISISILNSQLGSQKLVKIWGGPSRSYLVRVQNQIWSECGVSLKHR